MTLYYNNLISVTDGFSISAIMVHDMEELGQSMFGIQFMCKQTDLDDVPVVKTSVSKPQTGYGTLTNSIASFGIGKSNNYVEDLTAT